MTRRRGRGQRKDTVAVAATAGAPKARRRPRPGAKPPFEAKSARPPFEPKSPKPVAPPPATKPPPAKPRPGRDEPTARAPQSPREPLPAAAGEELVLVTGFEPFGGESTNPSWEVCRLLPRRIGHARIETCLVPCEFRRAIEVVATAVERLRPGIVLCLGQAGGRSRLSIERIGINVDDARMPDNAGAQPVDEPVAASGPAAYFATVPVKAMARAMREAGVPAEVSNSAGTYVCNHLLYGVLHYLKASGSAARAGFVHVPWSEAQALAKPGAPAMALATMARGVEAAIVAALEHRVDVKAAEGTLD